MIILKFTIFYQLAEGLIPAAYHNSNSLIFVPDLSPRLINCCLLYTMTNFPKREKQPLPNWKRLLTLVERRQSAVPTIELRDLFSLRNL